LRDDIARLKQRLATKSVSMNEAERRNEMAQAKVRQAEFDKETLALRSTAPATYEITLKNATIRGLPSPLAASDSPVALHARKSAKVKDDLTLAASDRSPSQDIILTETEHVLADYVALLGQHKETALNTR
jgi:hypothetical protein